MALHIDRVNTEMDVVPSDRSRSNYMDNYLGGPDSILRDQLRQIVIEIIQEELERIRREIA